MLECTSGVWCNCGIAHQTSHVWSVFVGVPCSQLPRTLPPDNWSSCPAAFLIVRRRRRNSPPSPPPSTTSSDYEDRAAAKAAALWSERSSGESNDGMSGSNCLRGSIADRLHNTKFDSESARSYGPHGAHTRAGGVARRPLLYRGGPMSSV